jgi:hypothetical protein
MAIKKAYQAIVSLLEANRGELVENIIDNVIELASAKSGGGGGKATTHHRDEEGNVVAIRCGYHKKWMDPSVVEFGVKKSSATGLNSMCKDGMSKWTSQNSAYAKAKGQLLEDVASGEIDAADVKDALDALAEAKAEIVPIEGDYQGFDTLEDCLAAQQ